MVYEMRLEDEGFKKPCGVGQVPFGRTGVGHPLKTEIIRFEGRDQGFCMRSHRAEGWGEKQRCGHGCSDLRR